MISDPAAFRHVLGHYPTGVCVVTAREADGCQIGMTVGSFTSVSLDPPLVGFLPSARSHRWARISSVGKFCVNVLAHDQVLISRTLAAAGELDELSTGSSPAGSPILEGVVAWIDCDLHGTHPAGDHIFVTGLVRAMEVERPHRPLLFLQGDYGTFAPPS